jgi:hypothetical protein
MDPESFKKHARKVTHLLIEKELKSKDSLEQIVIDDEIKKKVRKFIDSYVDKMKSRGSSID